jgi:uncharacterized protein YyaL (SSP411 family)
MNWSEWSAAAFARAEAENKPVLLSLVTAWSDECAVMDETTYSRPEIAGLIDERFVAVRVDADRRPDINDRYNLGGWPTTAFLTTHGDTLGGGTYFDPSQMSAALRNVADAYRDRADEIRERARLVRDQRRGGEPDPFDPDRVVSHFRSLLIDRFDTVHGGFGVAPKHPNPNAMLFALSLAGDGDGDLGEIVRATLDGVSALWDAEGGGFYRYADAADWSAPSTGKTIEENAALLHVYVETALRLRDDPARQRAADIVRWARGAMIDPTEGGFFNAASSRGVDNTLYVDKNAMMVGGFIRAAALFDDVWLRDFALKSLEAVIVPAYKPGDGVAHVSGGAGGPAVRGLLTDQIHVAAALIWAHAATGQLPYSMLAAEVTQFAIRTMWDDRAGGFRDRVDPADPVVPFELNCHAAAVLDRLGVLTGDVAYQDRARAILQSLNSEYREHDLLGAPYALAVREVFDRRPPAGLELSAVDWQLG